MSVREQSKTFGIIQKGGYDGSRDREDGSGGGRVRNPVAERNGLLCDFPEEKAGKITYTRSSWLSRRADETRPASSTVRDSVVKPDTITPSKPTKHLLSL